MKIECNSFQQPLSVKKHASKINVHRQKYNYLETVSQRERVPSLVEEEISVALYWSNRELIKGRKRIGITD